MASQIDFYTYPVSAPARMVLLQAKHMGIEMNLKVVDLKEQEQLKPEFLAINPQHTIPTMVDNNFMINESRAMLMYLHNKYGGRDDSLYPKNPKERALVDMRLMFDISSLYPRFGDAYYAVMFQGQKELDPAKLKIVDEMLGYVDGNLQEGYIAGGHLTIADFSTASILSTIAACGHDMKKFPRITAYLQKCKKEMKGWDDLNQPGADAFGQWFKSVLDSHK